MMKMPQDITLHKNEDKRMKITTQTAIAQKTALQKPLWYHKLASFLNQSPFYHGTQSAEIGHYIESLGEAIEKGDSCLKLTHLDVESEIIQNYQINTVMSKPLIWDAPYLYLQRYWALEQRLAQSVQGLISEEVATPQQDFSHLFEDERQKQALQKGISSSFCMITGGPGTGKTYILTRIVAALKSMNPQLRIAMAAPTGKAAQRMQEALQKAFKDEALHQAGLYHEDLEQQQTQTLHRLLGMGNRQIPQYNQERPLPYDVVVVDEASMLDLTMAEALFSAIVAPTRLILLGDANQLSSVDVGYVLADLQQVPQLNPYHTTLTQSRRFSDTAMIGRFAKYIYAGKDSVAHLTEVFSQAAQYPDFSIEQWQSIVQPEKIENHDFKMTLQAHADWVGFFEITENVLNHHLQDLYQQLAQGFNGYIEALKAFKAQEIDKQQLADRFDDYRILVAMKYGKLGVIQMNMVMTEYIKNALKINPENEWYLGRPVMMTYNDYQLGLSNGDIGICWQEMDAVTEELREYVYFPSLKRDIAAARLPQSIQTAYALTIHKSQGSEFTHTAVVLDEAALNLLSKELLYTAITRAKKMVSLYSSILSLKQSFNIKTQRQSGLQQQLERIFQE